MVSYYSYWSGVVSRASDSKLRNTSGRQIHGGRRCAVFVWAGIFSSGKSSIFWRYTLELDTHIERNYTHVLHTQHTPQVLDYWLLATLLNHLRLICMSDLILFNSYKNHKSSFIYLVKPSGFSAKHTALLGFVQLLNNILHCCDQSNRNTAHSTEKFLFFRPVLHLQ